MRYLKIICIFAALLLVLSVVALADSHGGKCPLCGMNIAGNENTAYEITYKDGTTTTYCCPHCGLWEHSEKKGDIQSARARDFISGDWGDPSTMVYLFKSKAIPACAPSWIAFAKESEAKKFRKGFGGTIFTFEDALKERMKHPKGMEMKM